METNWNSYQRDIESNPSDQLTQDISSNVQKIAQNVTTIERMVNQLGTNQDNEQLRTKLHDLEHDTKTLSQKTVELLGQFSSSPLPNNLDEQRKAKLMRERLTKEFTNALNNFQSVQRRTAQKEKAGVIRAKYDTGDVESGTATPSIALQQRTQAQQQVDIQNLKERQEAIEQLESDISDVNQIFKDLALMVHDQGEILDSIEANVDNAQIHVQQGVSQIAKAAEYQSRARRKKFICIFILIVCVITLIIILHYALK